MKEGVDKSAPSFGRPLGDVECDEGLKLRITTPIKGNPIPEFCWTKDGKPLSGDRVNSFSDGELVSSLLPLLLKSISFTVSLFSFVYYTHRASIFFFLSKFWANVNWNGDPFMMQTSTFHTITELKKSQVYSPKIFFWGTYYFTFLELSFKTDWQMRSYLLWRSVLCGKWSALKNHAVFTKLIRYKLFLNKNMYIPKYSFQNIAIIIIFPYFFWKIQF